MKLPEADARLYQIYVPILDSEIKRQILKIVDLNEGIVFLKGKTMYLKKWSEDE